MKSMNDIATEVAIKHSITVAQLRNESGRYSKAADARHEAIWLIAQEKKENGSAKWSNANIGRFFGIQYSSVIHARKNYGKRIGIPMVRRDKA